MVVKMSREEVFLSILPVCLEICLQIYYNNSIMAELITLPCGLHVCYEKKDTSLASAVGIFVGAGSRNETEKENGIAHFIEHMTFKGTEKRTAFQLADETDRLGANSNAYTSKTMTVYYFSGLGKFTERYFEILGDMLWRSTYTDENIEKERGVVLEEIHMYDDDGDSLCSDLLAKVYFGEGVSLGRPILGTAKTVKKLKRKDVLSFRERWYRPENMCISFVGDLEKDVVLSYVEKYFVALMPRFKKPFVPFDRTEGDVFSTYASLKKPFEQAVVYVRFPAKKFGEVKMYTPYLLANILGGSMSSRLFQSVREELGLAYEIMAYNMVRTGGGSLDIYYATSPKTAVKATEAVKKTVEELLEKGISDSELLKTRNQYETSLVLGEESVNSRMRSMGRNYTEYGILSTAKQEVEELLSVTKEEIEEFARETLDFRKATVCYVGKDIGCDLLEIIQK